MKTILFPLVITLCQPSVDTTTASVTPRSDTLVVSVRPADSPSSCIDTSAASVILQTDSVAVSIDSLAVPSRKITTEYRNTTTAHLRCRDAGNVVVAGKGDNLIAFTMFYGLYSRAEEYADAVNRYAAVLGDSIRIYCMPIPTQGEFYCPDDRRASYRSERDYINHLFSKLDDRVVTVDAYTILSRHADQAIYLRTDHHWAPLGAYYAAMKFAAQAGVPFRDLSHYRQNVIHNYVGSMAYFSKDESVRRSPQDFIYHIPEGIDYTAYFVDYRLTKNVVTWQSPLHEAEYFRTYRDGSGAAYCTFMGGDLHLVHVTTSAGQGRRLLILKDSFGNAIPGYLFYSFDDIHVADCRYFTGNIVKYIRDNGITDVLFANNVVHTGMKSVSNNYKAFLTR